MTTLNFFRGCRKCNQGSGMPYLITDWQNDFDYYEKLTDFEVSQVIVKSMINNSSDCEFCGANNFDIWNITVDGKFVFDLKKLNSDYGEKGSYLIISDYYKKNNEEYYLISYADSYPNTFDENIKFEIRCKNEIQKLINQIPDSEFTHLKDSKFYFCFSGNDSNVKLEIFRHTGLTKQDLIKISNNLGK